MKRVGAAAVTAVLSVVLTSVTATTASAGPSGSYGSAGVRGATAATVVGAAAKPTASWRVVVRDGTEDVWRADLRSDRWLEVGSVPTIDVRRADLRHGPRRINTRTWFVDLEPVGRQTLWLGLDVGSGFRFGRVALRRADRTGTAQLLEEPGGPRVRCRGLKHRVDYDRDLVQLSVPRRCVGSPDWVRVNVTSEGWVPQVPFRGLLSDNPHNDQPYDNHGTRRLYRR